MTESVTVSVVLDSVEVGVECPVRADGALPYAIEDLLAGCARTALAVYRQSGLAPVELEEDGADGGDEE